MKYLRLSFVFLTTLPFRLKEDIAAGDQGRASGWYSLVGFVIGGLLAVVWQLTRGLFSPYVAGALALVTWVCISGALHLDGLADCCDGLLNASSPQRRLEIMKDPRMGTFGVTGLVLVLLLKYSLLIGLPSDPNGVLFLILAPCAGRWLILLGGFLPQARSEGMSVDFRRGFKRRYLIFGGFIPLLVAISGGAWGLLALFIAVPIAWGFMRFAVARLGGITGDVMGATVELIETAVLLVGALQ